MAKYHCTEDGDVYPCNVKPESGRKCIYGGMSGEEGHFNTPEEAYKYYESKNKGFIVPPPKRKTVINPELNNEGLTENMVKFRNAFVSVNKAIRTYDEYRKTKLNNDELIPDLPSSYAPYVNKILLNNAWRNRNYDEVREIYSSAIKSFYMERVFDETDVDCLFEDDQIEKFITLY